MTEHVPIFTPLIIRLLGFHGVALACSGIVTTDAPPLVKLGAAAVGLGPWLVWCFGRDSVRARSWIGYGLVPAGLIVAAAITESVSGARSTGIDALRITAGVLAQLGATRLLDRVPERPVDVERRDRAAQGSIEPTLRARRRALFVGLVASGLALTIAFGPFTHRTATAVEQTFASVSASVLAATIGLVVLPLSVRRERRTSPETKVRIGYVGLLVAIAATLLGIEALTR